MTTWDTDPIDRRALSSSGVEGLTRRDLLQAGMGLGAMLALGTACAPFATTAHPAPTFAASPPNMQDWRRAFQDLPREHGFEPLQVEGRIPEDLVGTLYRNGPALFSLFGRQYAHWFDGDGAVSAVRFGPDGATGAVRLVQTPELREERQAGRAIYAGYGSTNAGNLFQRMMPRGKNAANTSVMVWQGELYALFEAGRPTVIGDQDLQTLGRSDLQGIVAQTFSAHPHYVAERRATYNFGVRYGRTTQLDLFELPDAGAARLLTTLPLDRATMIHDFIVTPRHLVFYAPPLQLQLTRFLLGLAGFSDSLEWTPSIGTQVLVVPIDTPEQYVRFETDPFYQWHFSNAFERGDEIVVDLVRYPDFRSNQWLGKAPSGSPPGELNGSLHRTVIRGQTARTEPLGDTPSEFPRVAPSAAGHPYRYVYLSTQADGERGELFRGIAKVDVETTDTRSVTLGSSQYPSEPVFVPRPRASAEDDGYLLTLVYDGKEHRSHLAILDARDLERGPLARAWFDHHIPFTFHGVWQAGT